MSAVMISSFNPLKFANRLKQAGVPEQQAEIEAEMLHEALDARDQVLAALDSKFTALEGNVKNDTGQMATKADLARVETGLNGVKLEIAGMRGDIRNLKWMMGFVLVGILTLMLKAFF